MDDSPKSKTTLRQALVGQWQVPLFVLSLVGFVTVLMQLRPQKVEISYDRKLDELRQLSQENRYYDFYVKAEQLRLEAEDSRQLGKVHYLVAQSRVKELRQQHQMGLGESYRRSASANYENIIRDYKESLGRNCPDPNTAESTEAFANMSLAYWQLNDAEQALGYLNRAIQVSGGFDPSLHRRLIRMYFSSRPKGYLDQCMKHLDKILSQNESTPDDRAWAYVRKAEVMIAQDKEQQALQWLDQADASVADSAYGEELEFLRGRALYHAGHNDQADLVLRNLIKKMNDRGDVYAQVALELGKINYEQFRDHDAKHFFKLVADSHQGKEWYVAAQLGMAECAALQQRYGQAEALYQEVVDLLLENSHNRSVNIPQVQKSLAILSHHLGMSKKYDLALPFLEIEQQIAVTDDVDAAHRFAWMHADMGQDLLGRLDQARRSLVDSKIDAEEDKWTEQQEKLISAHFEQAADEFLRVAVLAVNQDDLFGESLYNAAINYDKAGKAEKSIEAWERFVLEREGKKQWPRALFYLAQAYQSLGRYDQAITYYETLIEKHPKMHIAFNAIVPLARCYISKEPSDTERAQQLLLAVLDSDEVINPRSIYYRQAMIELGELFYNTQKYDQVIRYLDEAVQRYPNDPSLGKSLFLLGDSYRRSALALEQALSELSQNSIAAAAREKKSVLRHEYFSRAASYFARGIRYYENIPSGRHTDMDKLYLRHCLLYQAGCMYKLGFYKEASELYEIASLRYKKTTTALNAFIHIVNCHLKLGSLKDARSANQRALLQLEEMSDEVLADGEIRLSRQDWSQWFNWTEKSGLW